MVIFFELTNSSVIFWTIINEILWNLINTRKVISFINVGIEEEEKHNEIVEKLVERLIENSLYIKLEKYK